MAIPLLAALGLGLTFGIHAVNQEIDEAQQQSPLGGLNHKITDLAYQIRHVTNQDSLWSLRDVVVIDIDDASIQELGRVQLWPRSFTARVLDHVHNGDPAAVGLDILYTEPDTLSRHYRQLLRNSGFERTDAILSALSTDDRLASALRRIDRSYLALHDHAEATSVPADTARTLLRVAYDSSAAAQDLPRLSSPSLPIPLLRRAVHGVGPVLLPSTGGVTRTYPVAHRLPSTEEGRTPLLPSFSILMAVDLLEVPMSTVRVEARAVHLGRSRTVPVDARGRFRINWLGSEESIRRVSYHKVLHGSVPSSFFSDKIVLVGGSAVGLEDLKTTPVADQKPGVLVHAEALLNVLNRAHLTEWTLWDLWPWLLLGALPFLAVVLSVPPLYSSVLALFVGTAEFFGYLLYLFPEYGVVLPVGTLLVFTLATLVGGIVFKYVTEEWKKQKLRKAFSTYVSPSLVEQVTGQSEALQLGGEKKELTVLFADVRSFTTYAERLDPEDVVTFLNHLFDRLTESVFEQDGTVDKFLGDGMMAIFGAPLDSDRHAEQACAAALVMSEALDDLNEGDLLNLDTTEADESVAIGVGINTGEMVAGNIGSSRRFEYTVIGDAVNLGARLEPLNRTLGTRILVSGATYEAASPSPYWTFRHLGAFGVKGRERPVQLYELMDPRMYPEPGTLCSRFEEGLSHYQNEDLREAKAAFESCQSLHPDDGPSAFYVDRCTRFLNTAAPYTSVVDLHESGG